MPDRPIDLHAHSAVSDGTATPTQLVRAAVAAGLGVYLVATSASSAKAPSKTGLHFDPRVGLNGGKLDVIYTW